jgi:excisionase family DNA binding protein
VISFAARAQPLASSDAMAVRTRLRLIRELNPGPLGPERAQAESHGLSAAGRESQPVENAGERQPPSSDDVAESGWVETPFGAPVVRELPPDPGPHERLMTVRGVADRLGVCTAQVYRLCQRGELSGLRIGGALRFPPEAVEGYLARCGLEAYLVRHKQGRQ